MRFPDDLEPCRSGYSRNLLGESHSCEFEAFTRRRRRVRRRGVTDTLCWVCDEDQCQRLEAFHRQAGGQYFTIELPDWQGFSNTTARFDGPLSINIIRDAYEATASLYIPAPGVIPDSDLDGWLLALIGINGPGFEQPLNAFIERWYLYP